MKPLLRIVLGITGGIAAYKTPQLIRLLRKRGVEVRVVLTPAAQPLAGVEALRTVSGNPVYSDCAPDEYDMAHIRLAEWADWCVICPATANTIAKIAHGIADNLLTTLALSFDRKLVIVPAMNTAMWRNSATRANVRTLTERGALVMPVDEGELACGTRGAGRMAPEEAIADRVAGLARPNILSGRKVLISSGPTQEQIDPVRVITNRSSGKMGAALCRAALALGAEVTVVTGPVKVEPPWGVKRIDVTTAQQMLAAMTKEFPRNDVCVCAAAVSDFRPVKQSAVKLSREKHGRLTVELAPNPDIAQALGAMKKNQFLVGFSLETGPGEKRARAKMKKKQCDMMVLNYAASSIGLDHNRAVMLFKDGSAKKLPDMDKDSLAFRIYTAIADRAGIRNDRK